MIERERERQRVKKEKWNKPRRKKGRHWEMNKITRFQGKSSVFVKDKKHKILRRVEGQQPPKHTCRGFFCCPSGLLMVTYRLRKPCSLQKCHSSCYFFYFWCFCLPSFWWLCFVFSFHLCLYCALCFWFSCFSFLHFLFVWPKSQIKSQNIETLILMFCFGTCILALSLGPAKNPYSAQRNTPQNGICFIFLVLNNVLKDQFLQCFLNINQNFPNQEGP